MFRIYFLSTDSQSLKGFFLLLISHLSSLPTPYSLSLVPRPSSLAQHPLHRIRNDHISHRFIIHLNPC